MGKEAKIVWVVDWEMGARYDELFRPIENLEVEEYEWSGNPYQWAWSTYYSHAQRRILQWANQLLRPLEFDMVIGNDRTKLGLSSQDIDDIRQTQKVLLVTNHEYIDPDVRYDELFQLTPELEAHVDTALANVGEQTVGVHIRRGDHGRAIRQSPDEAFRKLMNQEVKDNPHVTFYLASDSPETKRQFQEIFRDRVVANDLTLDRDSVSGVQDAVIDLYCLANTRKIIGSKVSTFSEMAAKIGQIELERADRGMVVQDNGDKTSPEDVTSEESI